MKDERGRCPISEVIPGHFAAFIFPVIDSQTIEWYKLLKALGAGPPDGPVLVCALKKLNV